MKAKSNSQKKRNERKFVTIDVTDVYERLSEKAKKDIRTLEEECRFFIRKCLDGSEVTTVTFIQNPQPWDRTWDHAWADINTTPSQPSHTRTYPYNPCSDVGYGSEFTVGHSDAAGDSSNGSVDTRLNDKSGCYETGAD